MIKKLVKWFYSSPEDRLEFDETKHNLCDECGGTGADFIAGPCLDCDGNGFVDKSRKELWKNNIESQ